MAPPCELFPREPSEGFYTCQNDLRSTHLLFPKIEEESGKAFYLYLQSWGIELPVLYDGYEQFLKLQALFWQKITGINEPDHESLGLLNATLVHRWTNDQNMAEHIEHVTHALEGRGSGKKHQTKGDLVFVVHDDSKKDCNNSACPETKAIGKLIIPLAITLEPLLDWGTVKPASDVRVASGRIFAFRRNGPRMDDPLWTQQVKKLVPKQTPTYCLGCLEELMNRQAEAQFIISRSAGQPQGAAHDYLHVQPIRRPLSRSELYDRREGNDFDDNWSSDGLVPSITGSLHLDGTADETTYARSRDYVSIKSNVRESSWTTEDNLPFTRDTVGVKKSSRSQRLSRASTPPHDRSRFDSVHSQLSSGSSSHWPFLPTSSRLPTPQISRNHTFVHRDSTSAKEEAHEKFDRRTLLSDSVPGSKSSTRIFGRDIDTNAVNRPFTNHRIRRENMAKAKVADTHNTDIRNYFTQVNTRNLVTPEWAVKSKGITYEESDLSDAASGIVDEENDSDATEAEYRPIKSKGKARSKSVSPKNRTQSPKNKTPSPPSKSTGKAHQSRAPVYRKRDLATDSSAPFGVTQAAFETYLQDTPSKAEPICSCRKPARTNETLIIQCVNKDCIVRWYHKDCLSTRGKLQARHGTYLCQQCKNEKHYADLSRINGWTTKKLVQNGTRMPFTGQEIAGTLGNAGNFQAVADPYGLATSASITALSPFTQPVTPGAVTLSRPAVGSEPFLGLEISRPYFVTEAYTRAEEHKRVANEAYESAQVYGCYSDEWDEEMGEDEEDEDSTEL